MTRASLKIALAALAVASSTASLASVLVVRAAGPSAKSYPPGKVLPDSARIALQSGDSVFLLNANSTRTLRGPGTFAVASAGSGPVASGRRTRFAAMRADELPKNPDPWHVDATQSGKVCVADPARLMLWRPQSREATKLKISASAATLDWAAGKSTLAWPATLKIASGSEYQLAQSGISDISRISVVTVAKAPTDVVGAGQVLVSNGCQNQLDVLIAGVVDDGP
jgi:hypothetical protein